MANHGCGCWISFDGFYFHPSARIIEAEKHCLDKSENSMNNIGKLCF